MSDQRLHAYKDISILSIFTLVSATLAFFAQVFFARHLSISDYGTLSSSLVAMTMLAPLAGFGVGQYLVQKVNLKKRKICTTKKLLEGVMLMIRHKRVVQKGCQIQCH